MPTIIKCCNLSSRAILRATQKQHTLKDSRIEQQSVFICACAYFTADSKTEQKKHNANAQSVFCCVLSARIRERECASLRVCVLQSNIMQSRQLLANLVIVSSRLYFPLECCVHTLSNSMIRPGHRFVVPSERSSPPGC